MGRCIHLLPRGNCWGCLFNASMPGPLVVEAKRRLDIPQHWTLAWEPLTLGRVRLTVRDGDPLGISREFW